MTQTIKTVGRPKGSASATPRAMVRLREQLQERDQLTPDQALIAMRDAKADCMLCAGTGAITVEQRLIHKRIAIPKVTQECEDGKFREVEIDSDTECKCSSCMGSGKIYLEPEQRAQIEVAMLSFVFPKLKQVQTDEKQGKQLPQVNWLTSIRDPDVLHAKILEAQEAMSGDSYSADDDDSILGGVMP